MFGTLLEEVQERKKELDTDDALTMKESQDRMARCHKGLDLLRERNVTDNQYTPITRDTLDTLLKELKAAIADRQVNE